MADTGSGKPRHEKLSLKPAQRVCVFSVFGDDVVDDIGRAGCVVSSIDDADAVFVAVDGVADLDRIGAARAHMRDDAAIWVVWPKGVATIKEDHVRAYARSGDLVDVKVMSWSTTHSALRLVVRKELRAPTKKTAKKKAVR